MDGAETAELHPALLTIESLRQGALALASAHLRRAVLSALDQSADDLAQARLNIERWFNGTMDRASGWYKRRTQVILFLLGLGIAVGMNIDAIHVMRRLTADKTFREVVVKEAADVASLASAAPSTQNERLANARQALEKVAMPIGWRGWAPPPNQATTQGIAGALPLPRQLCLTVDATPCQRSEWLASDWWIVLCGWLVTAFAVMLGAPFWFDVLNKFMVVRSTVKPHEKSPEESSEDRQLPKDKASA